jgi:hypothetical protein
MARITGPARQTTVTPGCVSAPPLGKSGIGEECMTSGDRDYKVREVYRALDRVNELLAELWDTGRISITAKLRPVKISPDLMLDGRTPPSTIIVQMGWCESEWD